MFTSKNANINDGWRCIAERFGDPTKDFKACRQLWKNMSQKYKSFFEQHTGDGAGDDAATNKEMESWPYFQLFHQYASKKHNYHPPFLLESSSGVVSLEPLPPT
ncbi:uncharacterized protein LOC129946437 isoform X2 [Eupeodes corollae]|nr:uncharacterized protein LOC129946437 isoform X2 [Eupeodes corollae]